MNAILFLGPPASGKGTQAEKIAKKFGLTYFSTGRLLREQVDASPDVAAAMNRGDLAPDDFVMDILTKHLEDNNLLENIIIDGAPRSLYQYEKMRDWFRGRGKPIEHAIFINISEDEAVRRISSRREDKETGRVYNLVTNPPEIGLDSSRLIIRDDDRPEAVRERFRQYRAQTMPMIGELKKEGIITEVDGERPIEKINKDLLEIFEKWEK